MKNNKEIIAAHNWLRGLKASKKLSNLELGKHIKYSDTGLAKALRKETLSLEQIEVIAKHYNLLDDLKTNLSNSKNNLEEPGETYFAEGNIGLYLNKNHGRLMQIDPSYKLFIEKIAAYEAIKITKELLSNK